MIIIGACADCSKLFVFVIFFFLRDRRSDWRVSRTHLSLCLGVVSYACKRTPKPKRERNEILLCQQTASSPTLIILFRFIPL